MKLIEKEEKTKNSYFDTIKPVLYFVAGMLFNLLLTIIVLLRGTP